MILWHHYNRTSSLTHLQLIVCFSLKFNSIMSFLVVSFCRDMCWTCTGGGFWPKFKWARCDSSTTWARTSCVSLAMKLAHRGTHLCYPNTFQAQPSFWPWPIIYCWTVADEWKARIRGVFYFRDETNQGQWKQRSVVMKVELTKRWS